MRKIVILGSTGSIGRQTLDVVRYHPGEWEVVGLSAGSNIELLHQQAKEFGVKTVAVANGAEASRLAALAPELSVLSGPSGVERLALEVDCQLVVAAVVGAAGIIPTLKAIEAGKEIALANKETLVAAGSLVTALARKKGVRILPVDSEHSAIFQCLNGERQEDLYKIHLTASGGPFRLTTAEELAAVGPEDALKHPTWNMGGKITIDSATLMNKGLEVIEAVWLFHVRPDQIQVVVHPQSVIHSMVEFADGSIIAQLGPTDMRIPIQYALDFPRRRENPAKRLDLFTISQLEFSRPDTSRFPCLKLAFEAIKEGRTMPAVLNAANEIAVEAFLSRKLRFTAIAGLVDAVMSEHEAMDIRSIDDVTEADRWARAKAHEKIKGWCP